MEYPFDSNFDNYSEELIDDYAYTPYEGLTTESIYQSVQEACVFFNMNLPMSIQENWTTGVITGLDYTENDDILLYNREQLIQLGITDKEGFDLVMTHEMAHRALQGLETGFDSYQEELCCDFIAGVRAELNGMDANKMIASLENLPAGETHPAGNERIQAIINGILFANNYIDTYHIQPTFSDCLENFEKCYNLNGIENKQINLCIEEDIHTYTQQEINQNKKRAEHEMDVQESNMRYNSKLSASKAAAGHSTEASDYQYKVAQQKYNKARAEYEKWDNMKPKFNK